MHSSVGFGSFARLAVFACGLTAFSSEAAFASDVPAPRKTVTEAALDIIRMEACRAIWNYHVDSATAAGTNISTAEMEAPAGQPFTLGNMKGTKYAYVSNALGNVEICGWYFVPEGKADAAPPAEVQANAIIDTMPAFTIAGQDILDVVPPDGASSFATSPPAGITFNPHVIVAIAAYEQALVQGVKEPKIEPINIIRTFPPRLYVEDKDRPGGIDGYWKWAAGRNGDDGWNIRKQVAKDMSWFDSYTLPENEP